MQSLEINGKKISVDAPDDMPLLWVIRDLLGMTGTKFGCGIAQCGACTVHVDGEPRRSCVTPVSDVVGSEITTIEAIGDRLHIPDRRQRPLHGFLLKTAGLAHLVAQPDDLQPDPLSSQSPVPAVHSSDRLTV